MGDAAEPVLVLLPGLDGTGKLFQNFLLAWGAMPHQVVAYPVDQRLGYAALEVLVRESLPQGRRTVILGESFSGPVAIRLGANPPAGLMGVILCVTFAKNPFPWLRWFAPLAACLPVKSLPRWVRAPLMWGSKSRTAAPAQVDRAIAAVDTAVVRHRIAELLAVDETEALAAIELPVLVLQASGDQVVPRRSTLHILKTLPGARLVTIEGPHLLLQSRPAECAAAIVGFVKRCGAEP